MRVLVIKTSSLGDIIHTLPALTDAANAIPDIQFDWVVEEAFQEIPAWHYKVNRVVPVAIRRWRGALLKTWWNGEWGDFKKAIGEQEYYAVIDAQGLLKSAMLTRYAKGPSYGLNATSAREPLASRNYDHGVNVPKGQHAVERVRQLFAKSLGYDIPSPVADAGIRAENLTLPEHQDTPYLLFFHGTTWDTKHWPEFYWKQLAQLAAKAGYRIKLPWGNDVEKARAERIAADNDQVDVLPKSSLSQLAGWIVQSSGVVAVDTGLAHLSAALNVPSVSLYGPTDPGLSGAYGKNQVHLYANYECAPCLKRECTYTGPKVKNQLIIGQGEYVEPPCFSSLMPGYVFKTLKEKILEGGR